MEVVFLGTGAGLPTLKRSTSATALIRDKEVLLFDCGEGAQVQFMRAQLRPGKLSRIFISHFHGDHFYGLVGFLTSQQLSGRATPLRLYGPQGLRQYLDFMQDLSGFRLDYPIDIVEVDQAKPDVKWDFEGYSVSVMPLQHRIFTLGFRLEETSRPGKFDAAKAAELGIPDGPLRAQLQRGEDVILSDGRTVTAAEIVGPPRFGKSLAYCVDTRPCENAVALGRGVDLFVCEGTFGGGLEQWAAETGHLTVVEAAELARTSGCKRLALTHISARYSPDDQVELETEARAVFPETIITHDLQRMEV